VEDMQKRTSFGLCKNGIVRCWCGALGDFTEDINEFIVPILEDNVLAEFNYGVITVTRDDNANTIYQKFLKVLKF
jgi:hypothetical protein